MIIVNSEDNDTDNQFGGGKEEDRAILLVYKQLTDRTERSQKDIDRLTQQIFEYLGAKAIEHLKTLFPQESEEFARLQADVAHILASSPVEPTNFIGRINIVSLQLILLFSKNIIESGHHHQGMLYDMIDEEQILSELRDDYLDYQRVKHYLFSLENPSTRSAQWLYSLWEFNEFKTEPSAIFIIIGVTFIPVNYILNGMLDNIFALGLTFETKYADGVLESPFGFLYHDYNHGLDYFIQSKTFGIDREQLKLFFNYFLEKKDELGNEIFIKIQLIFFLIIHEGCFEIFIQSNDEIPTKELLGIIFNSIFEKPYRKFRDINNLGGLMSKEIKEMPENTLDESRSRIFAIENYLQESFDNYYSLLVSWHSSKQTAGRRRRRTKRTKKSKRRKTKRHN